MVTLINQPVYLEHGRIADAVDPRLAKEAGDGTMTWSVLRSHDSGDGTELKLKFDALASHDITYVGVILSARAGGLERFPLPYVMTNCHNSLCAVGGTINEDDHLFGLSAAERYGGIYVPAHLAVIHTYMRERHAACGSMILGSDSHTRYGALGTLAIGEGGPELVKQLLGHTYDLRRPEVVLVWLDGSPQPSVGPHDVALAIIAATFDTGFVKNRVMEFAGPGVATLSMDYRSGIDVMTTETACLSSLWVTDERTRLFFYQHGRPEAYREMKPAAVARYDGAVVVDLSRVKPMIALPFHPSKAHSIEEFGRDAPDILREVERSTAAAMDTHGLGFSLVNKLEGGRLRVDQGVIAGCAGGTFESLMAASRILRGRSVGSGPFALSVYPGSQAVMMELVRRGAIADLLASGVALRSAICGPCFGAGDVPANQGLSIRHTTRNFPNREGSKPDEGQVAAVALMDARSIAATAVQGGLLTAATEEQEIDERDYHFDSGPYRSRCTWVLASRARTGSFALGPTSPTGPACRSCRRTSF